MNRIKAWLCAHGIHWYVPGILTYRCAWCGKDAPDNYDDFFKGGPKPA